MEIAIAVLIGFLFALALSFDSISEGIREKRERPIREAAAQKALAEMQKVMDSPFTLSNKLFHVRTLMESNGFGPDSIERQEKSAVYFSYFLYLSNRVEGEKHLN